MTNKADESKLSYENTKILHNFCLHFAKSCHIQRVEIVVELGIFVFFKFSAEKSCDRILRFGTPSSYYGALAQRLQSSKKPICTLSAENLKENKDFKFNCNFNVSNMR